jgi:hypothetical protein
MDRQITTGIHEILKIYWKLPNYSQGIPGMQVKFKKKSKYSFCFLQPH